MSFIPSKTTYVRPLCGLKDNGTLSKSFTMPVQQKKVAEITNFDGFLDKQASNVHSADEAKEILNVFNSVHSKLSADVEEIRKWQTSIELESQQKNQKEEELLQTIESQRKMLLDLQLQNENLNIQLNEEIQKRTLVIEKLHSTKELCSALKKHYNTLQGHYEYGNRIEELINITDTKRLKAIEVLRDKLEKITLEYTDNISYLESALITEKNKVSDLKEAFEEKLSESKNENESLCVMLQSNQNEVVRLTKEIEDERNKLKSLLQERNNLQSTSLELEQSNKELLCQLRDTESTLKLVESNKLEIEKRYLSENAEMKDIKKKYEECLEDAECFKLESEGTVTQLKQTIKNLECKVLETEKNIEEEHHRYTTLEQTFQEMNLQKNDLEVFISNAKEDLAAYETLKNKFAALEDCVSQLSEDNKNLNATLEAKSEELLKCNSEIESITTLINQKNEELSKLKEEHQNFERLKEAEILLLKENNTELLLKLTALEGDVEIKNELINSKEGELEEVQNLKIALSKAEEELKREKMENMQHWRILSETETKYNNNRVEKEKELIKYKEQVRKLEDKLSLMEMELEDLSSLKSNNENMTKEMKALKSKISKQGNLSALKTENAHLKEEIEMLSTKLKISDEDLKKIMSENTNLKENEEKLTAANEDLRRLKSENTSLKENIEKFNIMEKELNDLNSEKKSLKDEIEKFNSLKKDLKALNSENKRLKEEIEKISNLENDLSALSLENKGLKEEIKKFNDLEKDYNALNSKHEILKEEMEKLEKLEKDLENTLSSENEYLKEEVEKLNTLPKVEVHMEKEKAKGKKSTPKAKYTFSKAKTNGSVKHIKEESSRKKKSVDDNKSDFITSVTKKAEKVSQDNTGKLVSEAHNDLGRFESPKAQTRKSTVYENWDADTSSGSSVFELVFDEGSNVKIKKSSPKKQTNGNVKQSNLMPKISPSINGKQKRKTDENELKRNNGILQKKQKSDLDNKLPKNLDTSFDFKTNRDTKNDKRKDSLWFQLKNPPPHPSPLASTPKKHCGTPLADRDNGRVQNPSPSVSTPRRFFKSSIADRHETFKKPLSPWF